MAQMNTNVAAAAVVQGWAHYTGTFLIVADSVMDRAIDIKLLFCNRENM